MERNHWIPTIIGVAVLTAGMIVAFAVPLSLKGDTTSTLTPEELAREYLREVPLIDGWVYHGPNLQIHKNVVNLNMHDYYMKLIAEWRTCVVCFVSVLSIFIYQFILRQSYRTLEIIQNGSLHDNETIINDNELL